MLAANDVRIDIDDVPSCDGLSFRSSGDRVLVLGGPRSLIEAAMGLRPIQRGSLEVLGLDAAAAQREGRTAGVPLDPPLPGAWTPLAYVTWSARLAGIAKKDAEARARDVLHRLELGKMATATISTLAPHGKRATVLGAALATDAAVLLLEDPAGGLPEEIGRGFSELVVHALEGRSWILFAPRLALTSPFALAADEALIVSPSLLEAQGAPAAVAGSARRYVARMQGPVDDLAAHLARRNVRLEVRGAQVHLDLGEGFRTSDLLAACVATNVVVVELHPVQHALG